jgi:Uma2 family endonuclease
MAVAELLEDDIDLEEELDYTEVELPDGFELIDGELLEMPEMGIRASETAGELIVDLGNYMRATKRGKMLPCDASFRCFPHKPRSVRRPDVAVVLCDPETTIFHDPHCIIVPALVVEVVSPRETAYDLDAKIDDFLRAGTKLVWEIRLDLRKCIVHYPDLTTRQVAEDGHLSGEDVLPGFSVPLKAILPKVV